MAAYPLAVLALVVCWVQQCGAQARITVVPTELQLTPDTTATGGRVTLRCEPPSTGVRSLLSLVIWRVLHRNPNAARVEVVSAASDLNDGNPTRGSSVTGTVDGSINQNFISLIMNQAMCMDGGVYTCEASYFKVSGGNAVYNAEASRNLTVEVSPGAISLLADPSGVTTWKVNDTLKMTCNGPVGTVEGNTQVTWKWEYKKSTDVLWNSYDGDISDIQDGPTTKPDACNENSISVLTRHLTLDDTSRIYRCYIIKGLSYTQFAAEYSVGTVTSEKTTTSTATTVSTSPGKSSATGNSASNSKSEEDSLLGPILGSVLAVILLLNIAAVVVFCWRRRSKQKSRASFTDDGDPSGAITTTQRQREAITLATQQSQSTKEEDTNYYSDIMDVRNNYHQLHPYSNDDSDRKPYSILK